MKVAHVLAMSFALSGCSAAQSSSGKYDQLLHCEMTVLIVANFHPSLAREDRANLRAKQADLSKSVLAEAASLKKTNADVAADQRRVLMTLQQRVQGSAGEAEARKMVGEANSCDK